MLKDVRFRIVVTSLLLICLALGLAGAAFFYITWHQGLQQARARLSGRSIELQRFVSRLHATVPDLGHLLADYASISPSSTDDVEVRVLDAAGRPLHPASAPPPPPTDLARILDETRTSEPFWITGAEPNRQLHLSVPLRAEGRLVGHADLSTALRDITDTARGMQVVLAELGALLTVVALALSYWVAQRILKPVEQVRALAARVAGGELTARLPDMGGDEVGELGRVINALAVDLQRNLEQVLEEKNKLDAILSSMVDGVVTVREDGPITFANFTATRIVTDWRNEQQARGDEASASADPPPDPRDQRLLGKNLFEVLNPAPVQDILDASLGSGTAISREISLGERFLTVFAIPLARTGEQGPRDDTCPDRNVLILLRDVTSLRQLETARSQFLGNVSHELKTPLTIIKGFVITLLKSPGMPDEWKRYLEFIDRESDRLARLVDDILNLARLRSKRTQMNFNFCEPSELLKETCRQMEAQATKYEAELVFECPSNLPVLLADSDRFKEIIINLVDNAFKYTPPHGRVELTAEATPEFLKVKVRDTGPGIPEEELPFLFERFFRGSPKGGRKSGGTGIGLAIVKEIVDAHRGTIDVESRPGAGTTFTVSLPLRQSGRRRTD